MAWPLPHERSRFNEADLGSEALPRTACALLAADRAVLLLVESGPGRSGELFWAGGDASTEVLRLDGHLEGPEGRLGTLSVFRGSGRPEFTDEERDDFERLLIEGTAALRVELYRNEALRARAEAEEAFRFRLHFLSNLSHELRTPLNGILGFSHLLEGTTLAADQKAMVQTISQSGQRLLSTIENILELAQFESGQFHLEGAPFSPRAVLEATASRFAPAAAEKNLRWTVVCDPGLPPVLEGDAVRLGQAWGHILSNAVKFTREGGVTVRLESRAGTGHHELTLLVEDTGIGMNTERAGQWFTPFQQEDGSLTRRFGGTGLGLALCDRISRTMGGGLSLRGDPGVGTKVKVWASLRGPFQGEQP
jgi:signal transduction histidine kinase